MTTPLIIMGAAGRMGRTIAALAAEDAQYAIAALVDRGEALPGLQAGSALVADSLKTALAQCPTDAVIIDFTAPAVSMETARTAAASGHAAVIGTTGLTAEQKAELAELARRTPLFWSSNMSVGINVLYKVLPELTRALGDKYDIEMVELHHNRKKDAPSGTALSLGECLAEARGWQLPEVRCSARDGIIGARPKVQIGIQAVRGGDVVGVHTIYFMGPGERIEVTHQAHSRDTFAQGALRAAAWIQGRAAGRLYGMQDVF